MRHIFKNNSQQHSEYCKTTFWDNFSTTTCWDNFSTTTFRDNFPTTTFWDNFSFERFDERLIGLPNEIIIELGHVSDRIYNVSGRFLRGVHSIHPAAWRTKVAFYPARTSFDPQRRQHSTDLCPSGESLWRGSLFDEVSWAQESMQDSLCRLHIPFSQIDSGLQRDSWDNHWTKRNVHCDLFYMNMSAGTKSGPRLTGCVEIEYLRSPAGESVLCGGCDHFPSSRMSRYISFRHFLLFR